MHRCVKQEIELVGRGCDQSQWWRQILHMQVVDDDLRALDAQAFEVDLVTRGPVSFGELFDFPVPNDINQALLTETTQIIGNAGSANALSMAINIIDGEIIAVHRFEEQGQVVQGIEGFLLAQAGATGIDDAWSWRGHQIALCAAQEEFREGIG
ncbi:MAG: hypothetical protein HGA19_11520, partial [Oscillochloris sp.]|nr:hypothetical protein [Oscillochloris sp.]